MLNEEECKKLMEEYEALRRRLEAVDFSESDEPEDILEESEAVDLEDLDIDPQDLKRLEEIQEQLIEECGEELPGDEDWVDIPEYYRDE